jgi:hypothetical protein
MKGEDLQNDSTYRRAKFHPRLNIMHELEQNTIQEKLRSGGYLSGVETKEQGSVCQNIRQSVK